MSDEFSATQQEAIRNLARKISNEELNSNLKFEIEKIFFKKLGIVGAIVATIGIGSLLYFPKTIAEKIADKKIQETFSEQITSMKEEVIEVEKLRETLSAKGVPPGSVLAFIGAKCPIGWSEFSEARGAALVGAISDESLGKTNLTEFRIAESSEIAIINGETSDMEGERTKINLYALYFCSKD